MKLGLRKLIHISISSQYKLSWPHLLKQWNFLEKYQQVTIGNKSIDFLEFYVRSIEKNILQPLLVQSVEESKQVQILLNERDRGNLVNGLWILCSLFSKEYPIIENVAILQEYGQLIHQHLNWKDLNFDELDKLIEVYSLESNSLVKTALSQVFWSKEVEKIIDERLKVAQENSAIRRKKVRNDLEALIRNILGSESFEISQGTLLPEKIVVDLLVQTNDKKFVISFYPNNMDKSQLKLSQLIGESEIQSNLHSPLKERVLEYKSYIPMFMNMKAWGDLNQEVKEKMLRDFLGKKE